MSVYRPSQRGEWLVECCFTSTETRGLLGTEAWDGHLHFHTAPELWEKKHMQSLLFLRYKALSTHRKQNLRPLKLTGAGSQRDGVLRVRHKIVQHHPELCEIADLSASIGPLQQVVFDDAIGLKWFRPRHLDWRGVEYRQHRGSDPCGTCRNTTHLCALFQHSLIFLFYS